jgi:endonuclease/exonuclease/phosphatase family metal-dependent hydrolase
MRVVTFNTGLVDLLIPHARERVLLMAERLPGLDADVIALQEVWTADDLAVLADAFGEDHTIVAADPPPAAPGDWVQEGRTGLALISRVPLSREAVVPLESFFVRRAVIRAEVATTAGPVLVLATHLTADIPPIPHPDPGGWAAEHMVQVEHVISIAAEWGGPVMLVGDLNCGPSLPGMNPEFEAGYLRLREAFPGSPYEDRDEPLCTFCRDNPLQFLEYSSLIDHVLTRGIDHEAAARRILDEPVQIDGSEVRLSDHYGLEVVFERL